MIIIKILRNTKSPKASKAESKPKAVNLKYIYIAPAVGAAITLDGATPTLDGVTVTLT